jgi:DNA polymerase/3'-5' exonuclease PolX
MTKRVGEIGGVVVSFGDTISNFRYRGVQVNLFLCPDLDSWGVTQMWATGPKGHTIGMTIKARQRGLVINSKGLWTRDDPPRQIRARTEEEVGKVLGWKFKPPEARGKGKAQKESWFDTM